MKCCGRAARRTSFLRRGASVRPASVRRRRDRRNRRARLQACNCRAARKHVLSVAIFPSIARIEQSHCITIKQDWQCRTPACLFPFEMQRRRLHACASDATREALFVQRRRPERKGASPVVERLRNGKGQASANRGVTDIRLKAARKRFWGYAFSMERTIARRYPTEGKSQGAAQDAFFTVLFCTAFVQQQGRGPPAFRRLPQSF